VLGHVTVSGGHVTVSRGHVTGLLGHCSMRRRVGVRFVASEIPEDLPPPEVVRVLLHMLRLLPHGGGRANTSSRSSASLPCPGGPGGPRGRALPHRMHRMGVRVECHVVVPRTILGGPVPPCTMRVGEFPWEGDVPWVGWARGAACFRCWAGGGGWAPPNDNPGLVD